MMPRMPRNAARILALRQAETDIPWVWVSFIDQTPFRGLHVYADSSRDYDWAFMRGLQACVVVRKGVDCTRAVRSLWLQCRPTDPFPILVDPDLKACGHVMRPQSILPFPWDELRGTDHPVHH